MTGLVGINNNMQQQQQQQQLRNKNRNNNRNNTTPDVVAYQIDCQTTKKGKMFAGTKRRICWKFGFSNSEATEQGFSGNDCRGEEHEVVFVWSLTSGKKFVLADGHEVHWSKSNAKKNIPFSSSSDNKFECTWESHTMMAGKKHELTVIAYASSPLFGKNNNTTNNNVDGRNSSSNNSNNSGTSSSSFRQFDLLIDGISFSEMPKMFQLGINKNMNNVNMNNVKKNHLAQQRRLTMSTTPDRKHSDDDVLVTNTSQPLLLLDCYDQYNVGAGTITTTPRCMSPSQSMPDLLLLDLSSSPTSTTHYFPTTHHGIQVQTQAHVNNNNNHHHISPTSVMNNPFDMYATTTSTPTHQQTKVASSSAHDNVLRQYKNCSQYTTSSSDRNIEYSYAPTTQQQQQQHSIVY